MLHQKLSCILYWFHLKRYSRKKEIKIIKLLRLLQYKIKIVIIIIIIILAPYKQNKIINTLIKPFIDGAYNIRVEQVKIKWPENGIRVNFMKSGWRLKVNMCLLARGGTGTKRAERSRGAHWNALSGSSDRGTSARAFTNQGVIRKTSGFIFSSGYH